MINYKPTSRVSWIYHMKYYLYLKVEHCNIINEVEWVGFSF